MNSLNFLLNAKYFVGIIIMHHVFVSFHHANDQGYKDNLVTWAEEKKVFIDDSVDMGEILDDLSRPMRMRNS